MENFIAYFQEYLIIGLLLTLFFKEALGSYITGLLGGKKKEGTPEKIQAGLDYMKLHYNDELTVLLTSMQVRQGEILDEIKDISRNGVRIRK